MTQCICDMGEAMSVK